jgi:hypothetical protein
VKPQSEPANRKIPNVHHTARQSRDREGALADSVPGMRSSGHLGKSPHFYVVHPSSVGHLIDPIERLMVAEFQVERHRLAFRQVYIDVGFASLEG